MMHKYRIKSEKEFIKSYGVNWKSCVSWTDGMDYLFGFGFELTDSQNDYYKEKGIIRWSDDTSMYISARSYWVLTNRMFCDTKTVQQENIYKMNYEIILDLLEYEDKNKIRIKLDDRLFVNNIILEVYFTDDKVDFTNGNIMKYLPKELGGHVVREHPDLFSIH